MNLNLPKVIQATVREAIAQPHSICLRLIVTWLVALSLIATAEPVGKASAKSRPEKKLSITYDEWVQSYADTPGFAMRRLSTAEPSPPAWVTLFAVEEEDREASPDTRGFFSANFRGCELTTTGALHSFRINSGGIQGGRSDASATLRDRVRSLLPRLPEDGKRLPPAGRCLVVRIEDAKGVQVHLYDRANAPEPVLELLRATKADIEIWTPRISPLRKIRVHDDQNDGLLAVSPDRRKVVAAGWQGPLRVWNAGTFEWERDIDLGGNIMPTGLTFSPDGRIAVVEAPHMCHVFDAKRGNHCGSLKSQQSMISGPA
ncbi:MAG: hypothetical protein QOE70_1681 [Chthoniobacter sp.]|jgi:hypothetical protein|nr:hypothetical protein [Chthoniobacter sp.]